MLTVTEYLLSDRPCYSFCCFSFVQKAGRHKGLFLKYRLTLPVLTGAREKAKSKPGMENSAHVCPSWVLGPECLSGLSGCRNGDATWWLTPGPQTGKAGLQSAYPDTCPETGAGSPHCKKLVHLILTSNPGNKSPYFRDAKNWRLNDRPAQVSQPVCRTICLYSALTVTAQRCTPYWSHSMGLLLGIFYRINTVIFFSPLICYKCINFYFIQKAKIEILYLLVHNPKTHISHRLAS